MKKYNTSLYISTISVVCSLLQLYMVSGIAQVYMEKKFCCQRRQCLCSYRDVIIYAEVKPSRDRAVRVTEVLISSLTQAPLSDPSLFIDSIKIDQGGRFTCALSMSYRYLFISPPGKVKGMHFLLISLIVDKHLVGRFLCAPQTGETFKIPMHIPKSIN